MWTIKAIFVLQVIGFLLYTSLLHRQDFARYKFVLEEAPYTRLCSTKKILTVNGEFPGPTIYVTKGQTIIVDVYNNGPYNVTLHWHGVKQPRNPWSDGPAYITQCPIKPGAKFRQRVTFSDEEGTLWWHAHSDWTRATVYGPIIIYPPKGRSYPFPKPDAEVPIMIGEWWKVGVMEIFEISQRFGGDPIPSDAYTINGQPGDLYNCSESETFKLIVDYGKTYLLRIINAAIHEGLFFTVAHHNLTVVGTDGSYTKPLTTKYIVISPGQTIDVLLEANQPSHHRYYVAARPFFPVPYLDIIDNTTTTAIVQYSGNLSLSAPPLRPNHLPYYLDIAASFNFSSSLRSLADKDHPIDVPLNASERLFVTVSVNTFPCPNTTCTGPNGTRMLASLNNISFLQPSLSLLEAYYYHKKGVFGKRFPDFPPLLYNFIDEVVPYELETPTIATEVRVLEYNSTVEIVFQGTNLVNGRGDHPMHLHGFSFYVVGMGLGIFDKDQDPLKYNLVDPPLQNTVAVPVDGWATIRFKANNPGVWFMHCHLDRHMSWGMDTVFIVKDGNATSDQRMLPPPHDMPPC